MKLTLLCHNSITHGEINGTPLKIGNCQFEYDVELDKITNLFTLKKIKPGLKKGFVIEKILFDGFTIDKWRDFLYFEMIDNPYVENISCNGENNLRFNGVMKILPKQNKIFHSKWRSENGWIFNQNLHTCTNDDGCYLGERNEHEDQFISLPYHRDIFYSENKKTEYLVLGCSVSFGTGVEKKKIWPNLIGKKNINLSCPGFGIDSIYITLKKSLEEFNFEKLIILFPNLERRLLKIGTTHKLPITINHEINHSQFQQNCYGIHKEIFLSKFQQVKSKILKDKENIYSKKIISKITKLFNKNKIFVSSWNRETYEILPNYFTNVLPFFEFIDTGNDKVHPGPLSHQKWANSIDYII